MKGLFDIFHVLGAVISSKMSGSIRSHLKWVLTLFVFALVLCALLPETNG